MGSIVFIRRGCSPRAAEQSLEHLRRGFDRHVYTQPNGLRVVINWAAEPKPAAEPALEVAELKPKPSPVLLFLDAGGGEGNADEEPFAAASAPKPPLAAAGSAPKPPLVAGGSAPKPPLVAGGSVPKLLPSSRFAFLEAGSSVVGEDIERRFAGPAESVVLICFERPKPKPL